MDHIMKKSEPRDTIQGGTMNMRNKVLILGLAVLAAAAWAAPSFANLAIQGAVGNVSATDGAALGQTSGACNPNGTTCVGFRIWSALTGGVTGVNVNTGSCTNVRCLRTYLTNALLSPGGYNSNQENTSPYNADAQNQPFYELVDASMNDAAGNHIGFFGVSGITADVSAAQG